MPKQWPTFEAFRNSLNFLAQKRFEEQQEQREQQYQLGLVQLEHELAQERLAEEYRYRAGLYQQKAQREAFEKSRERLREANEPLSLKDTAQGILRGDIENAYGWTDEQTRAYAGIRAEPGPDEPEKPALSAGTILNALKQLSAGQSLGDLSEMDRKFLAGLMPGLFSSGSSLGDKMIALYEIGSRDFPEYKDLYYAYAKEYLPPAYEYPPPEGAILAPVNEAGGYDIGAMGIMPPPSGGSLEERTFGR